MCRRVECSQCKKPTYAGCGMHIEQVLGDVARADRCSCRENAKSTKSAKAKGVTEEVAKPSILRRLFGD